MSPKFAHAPMVGAASLASLTKATEPEPQPQPRATISLGEMAGYWGYMPTERKRSPRAARAAKSEPQATEAQPQPTEAIEQPLEPEQYIVARVWPDGDIDHVTMGNGNMAWPIERATEIYHDECDDSASAACEVLMAPRSSWSFFDSQEQHMAKVKASAVQAYRKAWPEPTEQPTDAIDEPVEPVEPAKPKRSPRAKGRAKKDRHILVSKAQPAPEPSIYDIQEQLTVTSNIGLAQGFFFIA